MNEKGKPTWKVVLDTQEITDDVRCKYRWHGSRCNHHRRLYMGNGPPFDCEEVYCPAIYRWEEKPPTPAEAQELRELIRELTADHDSTGDCEIVHPGTCLTTQIDGPCNCGLAEKMQRVREIITAGDRPQSFPPGFGE